MSYCPLPLASLHVFQAYEPFQTIPVISFVHNAAPRFGHTANITKLISGSPEEREDYLRGLAAGGLAAIILFIVWAVVLIVVKCLGPRRVGWISGSRHPLPPIQPILKEHPVHEKDDDLHLQHAEGGDTAVDKTDVGSEELSTEIWNERFLRLKTQDRCMKGCVIISATAIAVCSILMVTLGVPGLRAIFDSGRTSLSMAIPPAGQAIELLSVGEAFLNSTVNDLQQLSSTFKAACPNIRQDLCSDPQDLTTCSSSGVYLNDVSDDYNDALLSIQSARGHLERVNGQFQDAHDRLDDVEILLLVSTCYSILLICLCVTLILSFCLTVPGSGVCWARLRQVARFVFFPIFVIAVLAAFSFAIASIVVSTAMADACVNSPDHEVKRFLINEQQSMDDLSADVAQYFIDGCRKVPNLHILNALTEGSNALTAFAIELQNATSLEDMEDTCGPFDELKWIQQSTAVSASMCGGSVPVNDLLSRLECSVWYGIYESVAHDTICYNVDNISLIAITQFLLVCFALIIVTCRVAIYQGIEITPEEKINDAETSEMTPEEASQIGHENKRTISPDDTTRISHDEETTQMIHDETRKDSHDEIGERFLAEIHDIEQRLLLLIENKFAELAQRR